jgi:carboxyl-terminal processing protease
MDLENDITHNLDEDLTVNRSEITNLIEDEIISRYFYEDGAIAWTIKNDGQLLKALEILNNNDEYNSILKGKAGSIIVKSKADAINRISELPEIDTDEESV